MTVTVTTYHIAAKMQRKKMIAVAIITNHTRNLRKEANTLKTKIAAATTTATTTATTPARISTQIAAHAPLRTPPNAQMTTNTLSHATTTAMRSQNARRKRR